MKRFTPLLFSLALFVVSIAVFVFLSFEISGAVRDASAARVEASSSGTQALYRQSIAGFLSGTESERSTLTAFVPTDQDAPAIIQEIEAAAKQEKVIPAIGSVSVVSTTWKYHEPLEIKLSARGSLAAVTAFATDLESLPQASHLSSFTVQASGKQIWFATYVVDFVKVKTPSTP